MKQLLLALTLVIFSSCEEERQTTDAINNPGLIGKWCEKSYNSGAYSDRYASGYEFTDTNYRTIRVHENNPTDTIYGNWGNYHTKGGLLYFGVMAEDNYILYHTSTDNSYIRFFSKKTGASVIYFKVE